MDPKWLTWYGASSFLLGIVLFFPIRKLITNMSINRHQRKKNRVMTDEEMAKLKKKTTMFAGILAVTVAFLYNRLVMFKYFGGLG